jgi:hypothetical protein
MRVGQLYSGPVGRTHEVKRIDTMTVQVRTVGAGCLGMGVVARELLEGPRPAEGWRLEYDPADHEGRVPADW